MNENRTIENRTIATDGTIADGTIEAKRNEGFRPFKSMDELIQHVREYTTIWYLAPMDMRPARFEINQYTISRTHPRNCRITVWHKETKSLVLHLVTHFDRFRVKLNG